MNKERQVIKPGTIVFFNRDVKGKELKDLSEESLIIVINGDLILEEDFYFQGDLYIKGDVKEGNSLSVDGNFICKGEIDLKDICIEGNFETYDLVQARHVHVYGDFYAYGVDAHNITVGKLFCAEDVNCLDICVGGDISCESICANHSDINVAGNLECREGIDNAGDITILGKMNVIGTIEAYSIKVGL